MHGRNQLPTRTCLERCRRLGLIACLIGVGVCGTLLNRCWAAETPSPPFRIGFASSMFTDVNENDARAAIKVWGALIAKEQNVPTDPDPIIIKGMDALRRALSEQQVDAVGITSVEYAQLRREVNFSTLFMTYNAGRLTEQYVLLAHRESGIQALADLQGRSLCMHTSPRACLAPLWLDTLLVSQGQPPTARLVGKIVENAKLPEVVLPVFFRKADACIVTRSGFDTMSELNPQVAKQLVVLAESPAMVPAVLAFRGDYNPSFKEKLVTGIQALKTSPAGRQVLTLFQSEDIEIYPENRLDSALELVATHARTVHE